MKTALPQHLIIAQFPTCSMAESPMYVSATATSLVVLGCASSLHRLAVPSRCRDIHVALLQAFAVLGNVMSLVGGMCSMCCSLLLPSLFYLILYKHELSLTHKCGVVLLLLCGVALLLLIVVQNLQDLLTSHHAPIPGKHLLCGRLHSICTSCSATCMFEASQLVLVTVSCCAVMQHTSIHSRLH